MTDPAIDKLKEEFTNDHVNYPDIMPRGIEEYPFVSSRINPIFYEIPDGAKVLDVGCNSGEFMKMLRDKKGCDVTGADISKPMVELATSKGLKAVLCDADKLPFPDATFDVVTLMEVLEHFHEPVPYLKEIRRVLKPGGYLLGSCPHANLERYIWDDERLHHQYYTELGLKKDLDQAFERSYIKVQNGAEFAISFASSLLANEPCEMLFKAGGKDCQSWEQQMRDVKVRRVWFGPTQLAGTVYFRMRGYAEQMEKHPEWGVEPAFEHFEYDGQENQSKWQHRILSAEGGSPHLTIAGKQLEACLKVADISVWQIVQTRGALSFLRCANDTLKKPIVTEIDDWFFDLPAYNVASHPYQPSSELEWFITQQIDLSSALVVSTQYLYDHVREFFPTKTIYVIPNAIDFDLWDNAKPPAPVDKAPGVVRIGYTGCGNHNGDLEMVKKPLAKLLEEFPNLEVVTALDFACFGDIKNPRLKTLNRWVGMDNYPAEVKGWNLDIGIAPLRDNNFNRAKSNLRWLEYSALKIPTIASRVYPFRHSIYDGVDGMICNDELEWYEAMKSLITDAAKRQALGETAYNRVKRDFNLEKVAQHYAQILKEIPWTGQVLMPKSDDSSAT